MGTAVFNLIATTLSTFATSVMLTILLYLRRTLNARTRVILSMAVADFIGASSHALGLLSYVTHGHSMQTGEPMCTLTGWINQIATQAADFSTFSIALITFLATWRKRRSRKLRDSTLGRPYPSPAGTSERLQREDFDDNVARLLLVGIWLIPFITATLGQILHGYGEAGFWCWIASYPQERAFIVRYSLNQIWRILGVLVMVPMYIWVFVTIRRELKDCHGFTSPTSPEDSLELPSRAGRSNVVSSTLVRRRMELEGLRRMTLYPAAYIVLW